MNQTQQWFAVAIDGPVGSGKSSISKRAARDLGFTHVDTGAIYRCVGLYALQNGINPADAAAVEAALPLIVLDMDICGENQRMLLNGEDVTGDIRRHEVSRAASDVSAHPAVRAFLLERQRGLAEGRNVVMDGRDIGTVVLPNASLKLYLTASPEERARRRHQELCEQGQAVGYAEVLESLLSRDHNDMNRPVAPLRPADDAVILDTTGNTWEESVALVENIIRERLL